MNDFYNFIVILSCRYNHTMYTLATRTCFALEQSYIQLLYSNNLYPFKY